MSAKMYAFDTLDFVEKLKGSGYSEAQARGMAKVQSGIFQQMLEAMVATKDDISGLESRMASKEDLRDLQARMASKEDLRDLQARMASKEDLRDLEQGLKADMETLASVMATKEDLLKLQIRFGGMLFLAVGALAAMNFFLINS